MSPPREPLLFQLDAVRVHVRTTGVLDRLILQDVDLHVPERGICHIIGASGAGKTTLLRLLNRLSEPSGGQIHYRGRPLSDCEPVAHRQKVLLVPQNAPMLPGTVAENLAQVLAMRRQREPARQLERGARLLHRFGLEGAFMERDASRLSAGERQRVALVRALLLHPEVLLLDEVGATLDGPSAAAVLSFLARANADDGLGIVHVTHRPEHIRRLGGHLAFLDAGRIAESGPVPDILDHPQTAALRLFLES